MGKTELLSALNNCYDKGDMFSGSVFYFPSLSRVSVLVEGRRWVDRQFHIAMFPTG